MPHEMDSRQQPQAQQQMMMQYGYAAAPNTQQQQHWQQPTQQVYQMQYMSGMDYEKNNAASNPAAGYGYLAAATGVDASEYYARAQQQAAAQGQQQQQQYMSYTTSVPMYTQQQFQAYGQMSGGNDRSGGFNAPPPNYNRPPPATMKRSDTAPGLESNNVQGSPLSVFENQQSSAQYTASWVSTTSSLPPDLKDTPEDMQMSYAAQVSGQSRGGNEWGQPGPHPPVSDDYGGTWGQRREEHAFMSGGGAGAGNGGQGGFDQVSHFSRMTLDDSSHHQQQQQPQQQQYTQPAPMTEWNSPEKNHPQQALAWQASMTAALASGGANASSAKPGVVPLMNVPVQPHQLNSAGLNNHYLQQQHQQQQQQHAGNGGSAIGNFKASKVSPMGGAASGGGRAVSAAAAAAAAISKDQGPLSWEERLRKAQGAKERAEYAGDGTRAPRVEAVVTPSTRPAGAPLGGAGGGGGSGERPRGSGRGRGGFRGDRGGDRGGEGGMEGGARFQHNNHHQQQPRGDDRQRGGFGVGVQEMGGDHRQGGGAAGGGGWKGGAPAGGNDNFHHGAAGFQTYPGAGIAPFSMHQGLMGGAPWRGGTPLRGGNGGGPMMMGGGGMPMRGGAGGVGGAPRGGMMPPMPMRGGPMGGFPMMTGGAVPGQPQALAAAAAAAVAAGGSGGAGGGPGQQDERFRSTWLDANMCIPALLSFPHHQGIQQMGGAPMMMRGGGMGGMRGGPPRGGFRGGPMGGGGGFRGGYAMRGRGGSRYSPNNVRGDANKGSGEASPVAEDAAANASEREEAANEASPAAAPAPEEVPSLQAESGASF